MTAGTDDRSAHTPIALDAQLQQQHDALSYGAAAVLPQDGLAERLAAAAREGRPLRVKLGIDPSGSDLTLGHAVVLRKLRQFQDYGHTAVLVVGGFTGQVGDPSGRTSTRMAQSAEQVIANSHSYFDQVMRILDEDRIEVVNNADWLSTMTVADILDYTRQLTIAQLLERDDFSRRFAAHQPISLSEFMYPLLQGIDSVQVRADIELGGTDQTFNNLVGRELQRSRAQAPQAVLTVPLLVGIDGVAKMGKSLGNYVAINDSADEQFGKLMKIPDNVVETYAQLCTTMTAQQVQGIAQEVASGGVAANKAKRQMAAAVVTLYHGAPAAQAAEQRFDAVFKRGELQTDAPLAELPPEQQLHLPALLVTLGMASSSSEARRLIDSGAVRVNGDAIASRSYDHDRAMLAGKVLAVGKRKAVTLSE